MNGNIVKLQYVILMLIFGLAYNTTSFAGEKPSKSAVLLEIIDGDTAFIVDVKQAKAWWVVGQCRKPYPYVWGFTAKKTQINQSFLPKSYRRMLKSGNLAKLR